MKTYAQSNLTTGKMGAKAWMIIAALLIASGKGQALTGKTNRKLLARCHTYMANDCDRDLRVSMHTPNFGWPWKNDSEFKDRLIRPGEFDKDQYACGVHSHQVVIVKVEGANMGNEVSVKPDRSVVAKKNHDGTGCDIFESKYGNIHETEGERRMTVYAHT